MRATSHAAVVRYTRGEMGTTDREHTRWATQGRRALVLCVVLPVVGVPLAFAISRARAGGRVMANVSLDGTDVSGLDRAALDAAIDRAAERTLAAPLVLRAGASQLDLAPRDCGARVELDATRERVLGVGRAQGFVAELGAWVGRWSRAQDLPLVVTLDPQGFDRALTAIEDAHLAERPVEGGVDAAPSGPVARAPRAGQRVQRALASERVSAALGRSRRDALDVPLSPAQPRSADRDVEVALTRARALCGARVELLAEATSQRFSLEPVTLASAITSRVQGDGTIELGFAPQVIAAAIEPWRAAVEHEPRPAGFAPDGASVKVVASERAVSLSAERVADALLEAAASAGRVGVLPLTPGEEPAFRSRDAEALGVHRLVGTFTTFHPCCQARVDNIHRAADLVRGRVLAPGETLSLNQVLGARTRKNGFVPAPTIEEGEMVDSLGGGVSQFTTTFFNVVFRAGYDVIERQPHTYWFTRYPMGIEATLSDPKPDFVFRNDTRSGLYVDTSYTDSSITVRLYGDDEGRKVETEVGPRTHVVRPVLEYIPNPELDPEKEKVKEGGMIGWSVLVTRTITFADGTKKVEKRKVTYKPRPRRVEVHPCKIPRGEPDYTGEKCPEPEPAE